MHYVANNYLPAVNYGRHSFGVNPSFIVAWFSLAGAVILIFSLYCSDWTIISAKYERGLLIASRNYYRTCLKRRMYSRQYRRAEMECKKSSQGAPENFESAIASIVIFSVVISLIGFSVCSYFGFRRWMHEKTFLILGIWMASAAILSAIGLEILESRPQMPINSIRRSSAAHTGSCYYVAWSGVALIGMAAASCVMSIVSAWK